MPEQPAAALSDTTLPTFRAPVTTPGYDRSTLRPGIVHIGVGGFHRAHLATYAQELCNAGHRDWAITGAGVLPSDAAMARALHSQDHLYTLITRGPVSTDIEVIGSIVGYIHAAPDPRELVAAIASPTTRIVSLTVTEGGYPVDDHTGAHLPASPNAGRGSAFATIVAGLERRRLLGLGGLTVVSCDNVVGNGRVARTATLGEAAAISDDLSDWIEETVAFPNSMVDRITPATTDDDRAWLAATHGIADAWPVVTEPFRQWVIEDHFATERPPFEELDVVTTTDVEPYEMMKLRLLNATHSCLAYLAALRGIDTVDAALADPPLHDYAVAFLDHEARPVLPPVAGIDLRYYSETLIARFSNPNIRDQVARLCLDGSAKFPKFLLPTVRGQLDAGGPLALSALALAGWCEYLNRPDDELAADPMLSTAVAHARQSQSDPKRFLEFSEVFGEDLPRVERFVEAFSRAVRLLRERGVASAIEETLQEVGRVDVGPTD